MSTGIVDFDDLENLGQQGGVEQQQTQLNLPTPLQLKLINKKIAMKFCEFKISNTAEKMLTSETISISALGILFNSSVNFPLATLVRIWIEMPDYWPRKQRHVGYRHTDAPTYFQMLARVVSSEETNKRNMKHQILCQTLNLDPVDEAVLNEYLGVRNS